MRTRRQSNARPKLFDESRGAAATENGPNALHNSETRDEHVVGDTAGACGHDDKTNGDCFSFEKQTAIEETEWEDGSLSVPEVEYCSNISREANNVTVHITESPPVDPKKKVARRASAKEKELAELVHKAHLLCLLARGRLIDEACNDCLIQASLLSLLPVNILTILELPTLTAHSLGPLVCWFNNNFRTRSLGATEGPFRTCLANAIETREGTPEEVAALSVALFRALRISTRFVSILDVVPLKPNADVAGSPAEKLYVGPGACTSYSRMVPSRNHVSIMHHAHSIQGDNDGRCPHTGSCKIEKSDAGKDKCLPVVIEAGSSNRSKELKRKGDLEFEMQLEVALSATAAAVRQNHLASDSIEPQGNSSHTLLNSPKRHKASGSSKTDVRESSGATWSRKMGPPVCWAEIFCNGEATTGRWIHVDAANALIDAEQDVESAAAACRRSLRYVVAFAGHGAKDVTRRYCTRWYIIAAHRVDSSWWDAVLAPLKDLESGKIGGETMSYIGNASKLAKGKEKEPGNSVELFSGEAKKCHKEDLVIANVSSMSSLEDMELETRALTEPLPTNQQAYKHHHLYALERWLTKYQVLHPEGPVIGYCSGHPVFPRACVQTLKTEHKWLREGLQVKANEMPAKVVKYTRRSIKVEIIEPGACKESFEGAAELYGKWQVEPLSLPRAQNGIVPKNEWGRVDVWSEKCLPPGTVHLRFPRLLPVLKRIGIDFAPAMVGFEFRNGHSVPLYEGVVICAEFREAILEAYAEAEEKRESEEKKKNEVQAISRWYQLLYSIMTRQRLRDSYEGVSVGLNCNLLEVRASSSSTQVSCHEKNPVETGSSDPWIQASIGDHEHVLTSDHQSSCEGTSMRIKKCSCGFSIQVEEL